MKPERLVKTVCDRTILLLFFYSYTDEIIDFNLSPQSGVCTLFICPDKDTPLDSVKALFLKMLKNENPNKRNDQCTKLWKEKT